MSLRDFPDVHKGKNRSAGEEAPLREPPHNLEAEQGLLGALLLNNGLLDRVALEPHHFFDPLHGQIYETLVKVTQQGRQATPVTLKTFFEASAPISPTLTVPQYLGTLATRACLASSAAAYAVEIRNLATRRALIVLGEDIAAAAFDAPPDFPAEKQIEEAESQLFVLASSRPSSRQEMTLAAAARAAVETANAAYQSRGAGGLATGFHDLDRMLGGLHAGDLVIVAGRPGMGKSALATNIALNVARSERIDEDGVAQRSPVHLYSLEMSAEQLALRVLSDTAAVDSAAIRSGRITEADIRTLMESVNRVADVPLIIDQTGGIPLPTLAARARRAQRRTGTRLIVIDYLQLMTMGRRTDNRVQEISEITKGLKALAMDLQIPVIALSQLSRKTEDRQDKRPQLSDLRESGSIEQDADSVLFVYREDYYLERSEPSEDDARFSEWQRQMSRAKGKAEIIVGKNRHGPVGTCELAFCAAQTRFHSLAEDDRRLQ